MAQPPVLTASLKFLSEALSGRLSTSQPSKPLVIGVSGPQGSGKSFVSSILKQELESQKYNLRTIVISLDDLYLPHSEQSKLNDKGNVLLKGRGLPGTHDLSLISTIERVVHYHEFDKDQDQETEISIPTYDKSLFAGQGDRTTEDQWIKVKSGEKLDVVILEGWFLGFKHLDNEDLIKKNYETSETLRNYKLEEIIEVNSNLKQYEKLWDLIDYTILYSTSDINNVVLWRTQQEHQLIKEKGEGMTDMEVRLFVQRYMVVYELYYWNFVKSGISGKKNLRIFVELDRSISKVEEI